MKKNSFFLILCLFLPLVLNTPSFAANKKSSAKYNSTLKQAKAGSPKAMFLIARMIERGIGTKKNINEASKWYQRAASQNYAAANARLGKLYLEGIGVKRNTKKAFSLLNLAAIQGIPIAQFNLAIVYELGVGTNKDLQEAIKWYDYAAKGGYYTAVSKSNILRKQLGLNSVSTSFTSSSTPVVKTSKPKNTTQQGIAPIDTEDNEVDAVAELESESDAENITIEDEPPVKSEEPNQNETIPKAVEEKTDDQTLVNTTTTNAEATAPDISLKIPNLNKEQKIALIKNQHINRTIQTLISGSWFDKNRPVSYLPSPKANCNIINKTEIKCISRELQRHTDKETIYYKTLGKISRLTSKGSFIIQYQNSVIRVVADKVVTEDGILYQSKIKTGLQKKIHLLSCQYKDIKNLTCLKDGIEKYNFKNRIIDG